jgi:predicted N-acetyltransferase YhbS
MSVQDSVPDGDASVVIELEAPGDAQAVADLVEAAFGPGRYAKTAERLREHNTPIPGLSFVAREDAGRVIGTVRLWPVTVGGERVAFLGPIAVDGAERSQGLGARLIARAFEAAEGSGFRAMLLVGDEPYFGRFGFVRAKVEMPGPVDPRRVLIKTLDGAAAPEGPAVRP